MFAFSFTVQSTALQCVRSKTACSSASAAADWLLLLPYAYSSRVVTVAENFTPTKNRLALKFKSAPVCFLRKLFSAPLQQGDCATLTHHFYDSPGRSGRDVRKFESPGCKDVRMPVKNGLVRSILINPISHRFALATQTVFDGANRITDPDNEAKPCGQMTLRPPDTTGCLQFTPNARIRSDRI